MRTKIINLEYGLPSADMAKAKLIAELSTEKRLGTKYLKIIHGYGSTGVGGKIKTIVHLYLKDSKMNKRIKYYCPGEYFNAAHTMGIDISKAFPQLKTDPDWNKNNPGISLVVIN